MNQSKFEIVLIDNGDITDLVSGVDLDKKLQCGAYPLEVAMENLNAKHMKMLLGDNVLPIDMSVLTDAYQEVIICTEGCHDSREEDYGIVNFRGAEDKHNRIIDGCIILLLNNGYTLVDPKCFIKYYRWDVVEHMISSNDYNDFFNRIISSYVSRGTRKVAIMEKLISLGYSSWTEDMYICDGWEDETVECMIRSGKPVPTKVIDRVFETKDTDIFLALVQNGLCFDTYKSYGCPSIVDIFEYMCRCTGMEIQVKTKSNRYSNLLLVCEDVAFEVNKSEWMSKCEYIRTALLDRWGGSDKSEIVLPSGTTWTNEDSMTIIDKYISCGSLPQNISMESLTSVLGACDALVMDGDYLDRQIAHKVCYWCGCTNYSNLNCSLEELDIFKKTVEVAYSPTHWMVDFANIAYTRVNEKIAKGLERSRDSFFRIEGCNASEYGEHVGESRFITSTGRGSFCYGFASKDAFTIAGPVDSGVPW